MWGCSLKHAGAHQDTTRAPPPPVRADQHLPVGCHRKIRAGVVIIQIANVSDCDEAEKNFLALGLFNAEPAG